MCHGAVHAMLKISHLSLLLLLRLASVQGKGKWVFLQKMLF